VSVVAGSLLIAAPVALAAGAVSFLSPCVLPLVPGYLSYVTGMSGADVSVTGLPAVDVAGDQVAVASGGVAVATRPHRPALRLPARSRTTVGAVLFVVGFSAVFIAGGALFGGVGSNLIAHHLGLQRVLGGVTIVLGLAFAGVLTKIPMVNRELRIHRLPSAGLAGAPVLGVLFGLGWAPCIGPTLATVLALAASDSTATAARGALLTAFYCAGLGLPFIAVAVAFRRAIGVLAVFRRHAHAVMLVGGLLLVGIGILEVTGTWNSWVIDLQHSTSGYTPGL
jgi:cytochrome c-type biogenesis protein